MGVDDVASITPRAAQPYLICTASSDYLTSLNGEWERLLGWTPEELMSRPVADFIHPADRERSLEEASKVARPGYVVANFEHRFQTRFRARHGGWRWLRWSARTDGVTWIAVAIDVTEEKEADAAQSHWSRAAQGHPGALNPPASSAAERAPDGEASGAPSATDRSRSRSSLGFVAVRGAWIAILLVVLLAAAGVVQPFDMGSTSSESMPGAATPRAPPGTVGPVNGAGPLRAPGLGWNVPPETLGPRSGATVWPRR